MTAVGRDGQSVIHLPEERPLVWPGLLGGVFLEDITRQNGCIRACKMQRKYIVGNCDGITQVRNHVNSSIGSVSL